MWGGSLGVRGAFSQGFYFIFSLFLFLSAPFGFPFLPLLAVLLFLFVLGALFLFCAASSPECVSALVSFVSPLAVALPPCLLVFLCLLLHCWDSSRIFA